MSIRLKVFWGFFVLIVLSVALILNLVFSDLEPRYRETVEEPLVDFSRYLAAILEVQSLNGPLRTELIQEALNRAKARSFEASIFEYKKSTLDLRTYVTDETGRVLYDSEQPAALGADYSSWRDVRLTLEGAYGARTSRDLPDNPESSVMYVAAPIFNANTLKGVISIGKPTQSFKEFIHRTKSRLIGSAFLIVVVALLLAHLLAMRLSRPIEKLTNYALAIAEGKRPTVPEKSSGETGKLASAFEAMRESLEGKRYIEHYVETLTHEIKSPLSAIKGAAELLAEPMPEADRARFLDNIVNESERLRALVEKLLLLSQLESKRALEETKEIRPRALLDTIIESLAPRLQAATVQVTIRGDSPSVRGDPFLVEQALRNLLENALDFSPAHSIVEAEIKNESASITISVADRGPGIPAYALPRVFERFYSLSRPCNTRKGTGLGLSFVKEVAELHHGSAQIKNREGGGAIAAITLQKRAETSTSQPFK